MTYHFAALRFSDDANLRGRVYWYLADFPLRCGEEVLAPVGPHDRLQRACAEAFLTADEGNAPYDLALIKRVAAVLGDRLRRFGETEALDFGGVRYDDRHYTRFGAAYYADVPNCAEARLGECPAEVFEGPMSEDPAVYRAILQGRGALLVGGEGERVFRILRSLLRGGRARAFLGGLGFGEEELFRLAARLG